MTRSTMSQSQIDLSGLRQALEGINEKLTTIRQHLNALAAAAPAESLNQLALAVSGMHADIAQVRSNTKKLHEEVAANTEAIRGDVGPIAASVGMLRKEFEENPVIERFELSHARLATRVSEIATAMEEAIGGLRQQVTTMRGEMGAVPTKLGNLESSMQGALTVTRSEVRASLTEAEGRMERRQEAASVMLGAEIFAISRRFDALDEYLRRPRWWQWGNRKAPPPPEPEEATA